MNRRAKVIIAVAVFVIPISVYMVWSHPSMVYSQPFSVYGLYNLVDEEIFEVGIGWPNTQMQVVVEVTDITGIQLPLNFNIVDIHDSTGLLVDHFIINDLGNYSTSWFNAQGVCNITVQGNGYPGGGFEGQITVYARGPIYVFIYGN